MTATRPTPPDAGFTAGDFEAVTSPELTAEELATARPFAEALPDLTAALQASARGRPKAANPRQLVSLRIDAATLERIRATGPGWQTRINDALAKAFPD